MTRLVFYPAPYQREAARWLVRNTGMLIAGMGAGKTVTTCTALQSLLRKGLIRSAWVLGPKQVVAKTWDEELRKWEHLAWLDGLAGRVATQRGPDWSQVNKPVALLAYDHLPTVFKARDIGRDLIVLDESTKLKDLGSSRLRGFLKHFRPHAKRVWALTAAPVTENDWTALCAQWLAIDGGRRLGSPTDFADAHMRINPVTKQRWDVQLMPGHEEKILAAVADATLVIPEEVVAAQRPDLRVSTEWVELSRDALVMHDRILRSSVYEDPRTGEFRLLPNAGVAHGKCHQLASGGMFMDPETREVMEHRHQPKLDRLLELLNHYRDENVAIAYWYSHELDRLKRVIPDLRDAREPGVIDEWNQGRLRRMSVHPASAGHGLNLQHGGSVLIEFALPWGGGLQAQLVGRFHRQGQRNTVRLHLLAAAGTVDEDVIAGWREKRTTEEMLAERLGRRR